MRGLFFSISLRVMVAPERISPNARPVRLDWGSLNIVMMADSSRGTLIWGSSRDDSKRRTIQRDFVAFVRPADAYEWTQQLREFLAIPLTSEDTGTFRTSPVLRSKAGDWVYLVRLKRNGRWLDQHFMVLQGASRSEERQLLIEGTRRKAIEFLETLESVNTQALTYRCCTTSIPFRSPIRQTPAIVPWSRRILLRFDIRIASAGPGRKGRSG